MSGLHLPRVSTSVALAGLPGGVRGGGEGEAGQDFRGRVSRTQGYAAGRASGTECSLSMNFLSSEAPSNLFLEDERHSLGM